MRERMNGEQREREEEIGREEEDAVGSVIAGWGEVLGSQSRWSEGSEDVIINENIVTLESKCSCSALLVPYHSSS